MQPPQQNVLKGQELLRYGLPGYILSKGQKNKAGGGRGKSIGCDLRSAGTFKLRHSIMNKRVLSWLKIFKFVHYKS